jgi:hypothetical protein
MIPKLVRFAAGASLCMCVGTACRSTADIAPVQTLDRAPRFSCVSGDGAVDLPAASQAALLPSQYQTIDDIWASVSRTQPGGWAGGFVDNGKMVLAFVDPVAGRPALPQILTTLGNVAPGRSWDNAELRQVMWSFAQLDDWYRYVMQKVPLTNGISVTDIDEKDNAVMFGVISEEARTRLINALNAAAIPCNLVRTEIQPYALL